MRVDFGLTIFAHLYITFYHNWSLFLEKICLDRVAKSIETHNQVA